MTNLWRSGTGFLLAFLCHSVAFGQLGSTLNGLGPISRSMGGATTAAPVDTLGAFQWNPATITALPNSTDFGLEILFPHSELASSIGGGAISGRTQSDTGVLPLPEFGVVYQPEGSSVSYGLGVLTVGGFGVNYPGSATNPVLTPPPPGGFGVGPIYTQYQLMQLVPTVAFHVNDNLSIGFSPILDLASLSIDPGLVASPDPGTGTYPPMNHGSFQWGAGFQIGAFYEADNYWQFGGSFKSTQWFSDFEYNSSDPAGTALSPQFGLDAPTMVSLGTAYTGIERILISVDGRYLNYSGTNGYQDKEFDPTGAFAGLGWKDVFGVSAGTQYQMTDTASVRAGYTYNTNPISDNQSFFNAGSPLIIQHGVNVGASYNLTSRFKVSIAYSHFFENSVSGPMYQPTFPGTVPLAGTNVKSTASADSVLIGASFYY